MYMYIYIYSRLMDIEMVINSTRSKQYPPMCIHM